MRLHRAKQTAWARAGARVGLGSRALVYGLFATLVVVIAVRGRSPTGSDTDQTSSLQVLGRNPVGDVVLVALAAAVLYYSLWRFTEAWTGTADPDGHRVAARVQALIEGIFYLPFGYAALSVAFGDNRRAQQGNHYRGLSAQLFMHAVGQALVALVGAIVVGVGVFFLVQGVRRTFLGHFDLREMPAWGRRTTRWTGVVGGVGRGVMFGLAGGLVVYAAITTEPAKAGGVASALDVLAQQPYGPALLLLAAAGFAAFAAFALCEATWRRT
ncbi:DUF1206 domain-containing protein [Jatrophihabitans endophyticus]|uniref:DUF1206 domain-containing protein n=1 Tax=Jatrophihabitans endophyticus TaxID=1206085 RepID=UPI0019FC0803|nr:DUF1206 domain-containing protein [Jatrophihabitans endophyticus]MBE7187885.1 DUF1206 domain-containing protein [Jatrophihabitans endophyticus]